MPPAGTHLVGIGIEEANKKAQTLAMSSTSAETHETSSTTDTENEKMMSSVTATTNRSATAAITTDNADHFKTKL